MTIETEPIVKEFFNVIEAKPSTVEVYTQALKHYSKFNNMTMQALLEEAEEDMVNRVIPRKQRLVNRLIGFNGCLMDKYASNSKKLYMGAVKSFYRTYGINIPRIGNSKRKNLIKLENQWIGFDADEISRHVKAAIYLRDKAIHQSSVKEIDWLNLHRLPKSDAFLYLSNLA